METMLSNELIHKFRNYESGDGIFIEYYPNEMYHSDPKDFWDTWENERFKSNWDECVILFNKHLSLVRRHDKLIKMRKNNPQYCNKYETNLQNYTKNRQVLKVNTMA